MRKVLFFLLAMCYCIGQAPAYSAWFSQFPIYIIDNEYNPLPAVQLNLYLVTDGQNSGALVEEMPLHATCYSDEKGKAELSLIDGQAYILVAFREGYVTQRIVIPADEELRQALQRLVLEPLSVIQVIGLAVDADARKPLAQAPIEVRDLTTGKVTTTTADAMGNFSLALPCGTAYEVQVKGERHRSEPQRITVSAADCPTMKALNLWSYPDEVTIGDQAIALKEGAVIELRRIFYDFDRYEIRSDASTDLSELAALMARYTELEIKLTAHTDARGSKDYNSWLSRKRAKAAKAFLVEKGIDSNRIATAGKGESMPLNDCVDGVDCSEIEHQLNRRTEVQITRFDRTQYEIHQHYNLPSVIDRMGRN